MAANAVGLSDNNRLESNTTLINLGSDPVVEKNCILFVEPYYSNVAHVQQCFDLHEKRIEDYSKAVVSVLSLG